VEFQVLKAAQYLQRHIKRPAKIAVVLGSGLGSFVDRVNVEKSIPYSEIPSFPESTVEGHSGAFVIGKVNNVSVYVMQGRFHYYEGKSLQEVTFPIRVLKKLGMTKLILTNAAGILNEKFKVGETMLIRDHINFTGTNPLFGKNWDKWGPRFPNLTHAYDRKMIEIAKSTALQNKFSLQEGVYVWFSGPTYETPAEVRLLQKFGADATGMSTVPEVIVANHQGTKVCGFSCLTNYTAGNLHENVSHKQVLEAGQKAAKKFSGFLEKFIVNISND